MWGAGTTHLFASETGEGPPAAGPDAGAAAPGGTTGQGRDGSEDRVLLRVNGDAVLASELDRMLATRVPAVTGHGELSPERLEAHRKTALQELVVRRLVVQEARRRGLTVTEAEVDAAEAEIVARFPDREAYARSVAAQGLDRAAIRRGLEEYLLGQKMESRVREQVERPTREQLMAYHDQHPEKFRIPPRAAVAYLLARVDPSAPKEAWTRARTQVEAVAARVAAGEPWSHVAAQAGEEAGVELVDLGRLHEGQAELAEIDRAAFAPGAGETVGPIWTLYGYALAHVTGREPPGQLAFADLDLELFEREWLAARRAEVVAAWTAGLMERAELVFGE